MEKPSTVERTADPIVVFSNSYARLPEHFFARLTPTAVPRPSLIKFNDALALDLGFDPRGLGPDELAAVFAGNVVPPGAEPIAMAYAGHQFGNFVPAAWRWPRNPSGRGRWTAMGSRRDIQLKGAGSTPFSRRGDGRAALGPVLREYLVSEAMYRSDFRPHAPWQRSRPARSVFRDRRLPGAILTRVASSHIRVGPFEYFAARGTGFGQASCRLRRSSATIPSAARRRETPPRAASLRRAAPGAS